MSHGAASDSFPDRQLSDPTGSDDIGISVVQSGSGQDSSKNSEIPTSTDYIIVPRSPRSDDLISNEFNEGFRTPPNRIPLITECPGAPKRPASCRERTISLLPLVDESQLFCGRCADLVTEIDAWFDQLENENRKRIKKARREALKLTHSD